MILGQLHGIWMSHLDRAYGAMIWAAALTCFLFFFRSGEITILSVSSYDPQCHLSWGDVAIDNPVTPSRIRVHLRCSKCDPIGRGNGCLLWPSGWWAVPCSGVAIVCC